MLTVRPCRLHALYFICFGRYVVQAYLAHQADQSAHERDHELHKAELQRQREHEQMIAQIKRTDHWLDDCCRPMAVALSTAAHVRGNFVCELCAELEQSRPELVTAMLAKATAKITADGKVHIPLLSPSGQPIWEPISVESTPVRYRRTPRRGKLNRSKTFLILDTFCWWRTYVSFVGGEHMHLIAI